MEEKLDELTKIFNESLNLISDNNKVIELMDKWNIQLDNIMK